MSKPTTAATPVVFSPTPPSRPKSIPAGGAASSGGGASSKHAAEELRDLMKTDMLHPSVSEASLARTEDWGVPSESHLVAALARSKTGVRYLVAADYPRLLKAAEDGDVTAQANLGLCYSRGIGVDRNLEEAAKWYRLAADKGNAEAQVKLGDCYYNGQGVVKSAEEAVRWYLLAAAKGNADAQVKLGTCCFNGKGVDKNLEQAAKWYRLAADKGNAAAQDSLGLCYARGEGVAKDFKKAVELFTSAAGSGSVYAQVDLGICYSRGIGVDKNPKEAAKWYHLAADKGNAEAQVKLGDCYYCGEGVAKDFKKAVELFTSAADKGDKNAQFNLGFSLFFGHGVEKSTTSAIWRFAKSGSGGLEILLMSYFALKFAISVDKSVATNKKLTVDQIIDVIDVLGQSPEIASKRIAKNESTLIADLAEVSEIDLDGLRKIKQRLSEVAGIDVARNASFKSIDDKIGSMVVSNPLAAVGATPSPNLTGGGASSVLNPLASLRGGFGK